MLDILLIAAGFVVLYRALARLESGAALSLAPRRPPSPRLVQLTDYADRLFAEKKWLAAEKAYLGVLKLDHKNAGAYVHLGIIYSTQKNFPDAIEAFGIAARLRPSGPTYQNLGLAYYDNKNYIKSIAAFQKAIMFEPTAPRYVGLSRAHQKLHDQPKAVAALEEAAKLDSGPQITKLLAEAKAAPQRPAA